MAYYGYLPLIKNHLHLLTHYPSFLEIGIDKGVSYLSLVAYLARDRPEFMAVGIDVLLQPHVSLLLENFDLDEQRQRAVVIVGNSLQVLPTLVADNAIKFDVILLDGDHNYHTVAAELALISQLVRPDGLIVIDDYDGRWSELDLWYAERSGYEHVAAATHRVATDKHGVRAAVDEWLLTHPSWQLSKPIPGEPVVLKQV